MSETYRSDSISVADALVHARSILGSHPAKAAEQARAIIQVEPGIAESYLLLATALRFLGSAVEADEAERQAIQCALQDPVIVRATEQISEGKYGPADQLLNHYLADTPNDPVAVHLRARIQLGLGHTDEAERLFRRSVTLAPGYDAARADLEELQSELGSTGLASDSRLPGFTPIDDEPWFTSRPPGAEDESPDDPAAR
jgi:predicted Zn-dependent protease